jgi:hypothetical protein
VYLSALSLEYVRVPVSATANGSVVNVSADVVQMAFPASGIAPVVGDWKAASWETDATHPTGPVYYARCLVGPSGTVALAAGTYDVWAKITDNPEVPARKAGVLFVS